VTEPSVGRIVHYVAYGTPGGEFPAGTCRAAIVTEVGGRAVDPNTGGEADAWVVGVAVLNPTGLFFDREIVQHDGDSDGHHFPGTWHWPERVDG
jgi:hypothetical protein